MQKTEAETFKQILKKRLEAIEHGPKKLDEIAVENRPDLVDAAQYAAERDLAIQQLENDASIARHVRAALDRIEDGTYGWCVRCDGEISSKRLNAVPWAAHCVACQEILDATADREEESELAIRWG